jgi:hypothetical protein
MAAISKRGTDDEWAVRGEIERTSGEIECVSGMLGGRGAETLCLEGQETKRSDMQRDTATISCRKIDSSRMQENRDEIFATTTLA